MEVVWSGPGRDPGEGATAGDVRGRLVQAGAGLRNASPAHDLVPQGQAVGVAIRIRQLTRLRAGIIAGAAPAG